MKLYKENLIYKHNLTENTAKSIFDETKQIIYKSFELFKCFSHPNNSDIETEIFRIGYEMEQMKIKRRPLGKFNYFTHLLGTELTKSQSNPYNFVTKKHQMYMCDLKEVIEIYLSIFNEETLFPTMCVSEGYSSFMDGARFSPKIGDDSSLKLFI